MTLPRRHGAYVRVMPVRDYSVVCTACRTETPFPKYQAAVDAAREHNHFWENNGWGHDQ